MNKTIFLAIAAMLATAFTSCGEHSFSDETYLLPPSVSSDDGDYTPGVVGPLLQTKWSQGTPYNNMTPLIKDAHSPVGCGATAMAQIMKYHNHPAQGTGQKKPVGLELVNFEINYDWDNMLDTYTNANPGTDIQQNAIATLMYHAGVASDMRYGSDEDGSSTSIYSIANALTTYFGYNKNIRVIERVWCNKKYWEKTIREQLDADLPMVIRGESIGTAHLFTVDGYNNIGQFHINLGWNGNSNAWVFLNEMKYYNINQRIIINIKPDEGDATSHAMGLYSFTINKPSVYQPALHKNESFEADYRVYNVGSEALPLDSIGLALVDNNDNFEAFVYRANTGNIGSSISTSGGSSKCLVPNTVRPGQYRLKIVFKLKGENWKLAEFPENINDVPNSIDITVADGEAPDIGYGLGLERFSPAKTSAFQEEPFKIILGVVNIISDRIEDGQLRAVLFDMDGNMVADIATKALERLYSRDYKSVTLNCSIPASVAPGQYILKIDFKPSNQTERKIIDFSLPNIPNSINFEVQQ
jgi:hypothetical protein